MRSTLYAFMVTAVWFQLTTQQGVQQQQTGQQGNQGQQGVQQVDQYGRPTQQQTQQGNQYGKTIQQQGQQVDQYGQPTQRPVQQGYQYGQATPPGNQFGQNIPNSNQQYNQPSYNQPGSPYTNPQKPGYISMICDMGFVPLSDADIEAMANFEAQGDSQAGDNSQVDGTYNPNTQSTTSNNTGTTTPPSTTGGGTRAINQVTPNSANAAPTTAQSRLNRRSMQNPASTTNQGISSSTATGQNFGTGNGSSNTLDGQAASQTFPNSNSVTTNTMSSNHPGGNFPISNGNGLNTGTSGSSLSGESQDDVMFKNKNIFSNRLSCVFRYTNSSCLPQ